MEHPLTKTLPPFDSIKTPALLAVAQAELLRDFRTRFNLEPENLATVFLLDANGDLGDAIRRLDQMEPVLKKALKERLYEVSRELFGEQTAKPFVESTDDEALAARRFELGKAFITAYCKEKADQSMKPAVIVALDFRTIIDEVVAWSFGAARASLKSRVPSKA